ncbi:MAG: ATP-binding cassette domain-containing protein, partial [Opitutus sp.]
MADTLTTRNPFTEAETQAVGVAFEDLSKSFGQVEVLRKLSFSVAPGEIFVLMGPSGSGKSVLLKHIVALEAPTSGRVTVDGKDAAAAETRET